jgi:predicted lysophospholipase L1 biosynthesis ABC-type transport system permease subunit
MIAVGVLTATLTFGASLTRLADQPRRQGWNWDVSVGNPHSDDVAAVAVPSLAADPDVVAFSALAGAGGGPGARVDGHDPGGLFALQTIKGSVLPPFTAGRPPQGPDEIALGAKTLRTLHRQVGQRVTLATQDGQQHIMRVSGRMVLTPPVVNDSIPLGGGALVTFDGMHALRADAPVNVFLVRLSPTANRPAALHRLQKDFPETVLPAVRPADIENLRRVDKLPALLAGLFAVVALLTVGHTLVSSVRRRRHDLAVLRTMGFVRRQVSVAVAWQASTVAVVALVTGMPLGIAAGRWTWTLVSDQLGLPANVIVPARLLVLVVPACLAATNAVAAVPGWLAGRIQPAAILRTE